VDLQYTATRKDLQFYVNQRVNQACRRYGYIRDITMCGYQIWVMLWIYEQIYDIAFSW